MYKIFIAGIAAISLTLSSAAPARANGFSEEDIGKFLFGLIAAGVAANIISNSQDKDDAAPAPRQAVDALPSLAPHLLAPRAQPRNGWHTPRRAQAAKILPRECLKSIDSRYGTYRMFQRNCMQDNYRFINSLPRNCTVRVMSHKGARNGWDAQCLRQAGYTSRR